MRTHWRRALSSPDFALFTEFRREAATLLEVQAKVAAIHAGTAGNRWSIVDGLVLYCNRIFIPTTSALWSRILAVAHGAGHEGVQKTLNQLRSSFFCPQATRLVREYIKVAPSVGTTKPSISTQRAS